AKGFKDAGSKVIMGGPHISCLPDEALEYCDSVVIGDCESVWLEIIQDYENDCLKQKYFKPVTEEDHHTVNVALLDLSPKDIAGYLEATRGCKFQCDFCSVPYLSNATIYKRPIEDVIALLKKAKTEYKHLGFIDTNLFNNPPYAKELFAEMKKLNITWRMQCTIDIAKDDEALKLAKESGCTSILFGYEIVADSKEKEKKGKYSMADQYIEFTKKIQKLGIKVKAQFIFGFENDTLRNIFDIWKFSLVIMPQFSSTSLLTPLPGSKLYKNFSAENRITNLNWRRYSLSYMVFKHNNFRNSTITRLFPFVYSFINLTASSGGLMISLLTLFTVTFITISTKYYFILLNIK
ncbi:MAG: radical SAM protein, partial [Candidatus Omnitrophica bacterium]|nr:radical SAM protein [Candidatus Omnitrophota bacterium]